MYDNPLVNDLCGSCPNLCDAVCPALASEPERSYSPRAMFLQAKLLQTRSINLEVETALPLFKCMDCAACTQFCEHHIDVAAALRPMRLRSVKNYAAPERIYQFENRFHRYNNPYGQNLLPEVMKYLPEKSSEAVSDVLYWPSCHTMRHYPERVNKVVQFLRYMGISNPSVYLPDIQCCGHPLYTLGFERDFEELAEIHYYSLRDYEWIIVDGSECHYNLQKIYAEKHFDLQSKLIHLLKFIAPFLEKANYRARYPDIQEYVYFDTPQILKQMELFELPLQIIRQFFGQKTKRVFNWDDPRSSCGLGGGYEYLFPEQASQMAAQVLQECKQLNIKQLITSCAHTQSHLQSSHSGVRIYDLFELIADAILPK